MAMIRLLFAIWLLGVIACLGALYFAPDSTKTIILSEEVYDHE